MHIIQKSDSTQLRIQLSEYQGRDILDIRTYVKTKASNGDYFPTGKGVSVEPSLLGEIIQALQDLKSEIRMPNIKCRYEIAQAGFKVEGKPRFAKVSDALVEEGDKGDFIYEVQLVSGSKPVALALYKWSGSTWKML
jgi:hypothetical protein